jgi:NodT family efflux transporter outer membrane factor (OMF) lipoprotein
LSAGRSGEPATGTAALSVSGSWSPDLWGNLADAVRAQAANVQANQADLAAAQLSAQGSFAQGYFTVREADAELALLDEIIAGYERAETITQNRYDNGIAPHTDLLQAQSTLASARANRDQLAASRDTAEHALALLLGLPPAQFSLPPGSWTATVPQVPATLPADLLLRRPDIASAERAVASANANIGVARAAYFPNIGLTASAGRSAISLAKLISAPALAWSLGLSAAETLFDGGARAGAVAQAQAQHDAATAAYRQTVLTAMGQVEDDLTDLASLAGQIEQTRIAAQAAQGAAERMMNSYQAGISAYTDVVTAQATALTQRRALLQLQVQRQQTAIGLIQALGGGWIAPWAKDDQAHADTGASAQPHGD